MLCSWIICMNSIRARISLFFHWWVPSSCKVAIGTQIFVKLNVFILTQSYYLLSLTSHNIKLTIFKYTLVVFCTFTILSNHHLFPVSKYFHLPKRKPHTHLVVTPHTSHHPNPWQPLMSFLFSGNRIDKSYPSVSMDLPIADISYKWNHIIWKLFVNELLIHVT